MEDLLKTKIDRTEDIRHTYLRELVKNVFGTIANSIKKDNVNSIIIIRGKGKELKDCSFTEKYYFEYVDLFRYTFTRKDCTFEYQGARLNNRGYNRDTAVANAVSFFNKHNVDLSYSFHSQAEQALFSRLIYKYISWLLEVLFEDHNCEGNERDRLVEEKYEKAFSRIKSEINTNDIIDLIYSEAKIGDIEQITDPKLDKSGFNIAYLVDTEQFQPSILRVKKDVICNINGYDSAIASNIIMNKSGIKYHIFPFKKNSRFSVEKDTHNLSLRIWENICREMYCPRYFWYVTKNTEYDSNSEEASLYDYRFNRSKAEILGAAISALETKYSYNKRKNYLQWMASLNEVLRRIYSENYASYFSKDKAKKKEKGKGYLNLKSFLKDNTIDELDPKTIYIYLVSVAIDNLCSILDNFDYEEINQHVSKDDKTYKEHCSYLKEICNSKSLETAISKYTAFYNENKSAISAFVQKVEISKTSCDEALLSTEYNPYLFLKNSLHRYYNCLCNKQEPFIYFDIGSSSIELSGNNNKEILYFENGKNYRIEFEACGRSDDPFSFIIINKKADGALVSVFDKSDIILTSDMQKYCFEFSYNGTDNDRCYLTFGYGTSLGGFKLQNLNIFEIG